ncbi:MAG: DUF554 domain-containing protein [Chloroflexi bacterium]|nr:DUF554 domain-containing protein [Chloroflexota bacterium]
MTGTIINVITVIIGGMLGARLGARLPERVRVTVINGIGLLTLVIGMQMALTTRNILIVMASVLLGGILGEAMGIHARLDQIGNNLQARFARGDEKNNFTRGFITASLVFCVGPLTLLGSIQDGLLGDYKLLAIKSLLDAFAGMAFASTLGVGVVFAALTVFVYQGGIALAARLFGSALGAVTRDTPWVIEMTATGGVLILGIGLILLELKPVRVANLLPAIVIAPIIVTALDFFKIILP